MKNIYEHNLSYVNNFMKDIRTFRTTNKYTSTFGHKQCPTTHVRDYKKIKSMTMSS